MLETAVNLCLCEAERHTPGDVRCAFLPQVAQRVYDFLSSTPQTAYYDAMSSVGRANLS